MRVMMASNTAGQLQAATMYVEDNSPTSRANRAGVSRPVDLLKAGASADVEIASEKSPLLKSGDSKQRLSSSPSGERLGLALGMPVAVLAGLAYCLTSGGMVLLNKAALSSFGWRAPDAVLLLQAFFCVVLAKLTEALGYVKLEPLSWKVVKIWMPVNLIFVGMIATSFLAIKDLTVPMVTLLKSCTNFFVVAGDMSFYGKRYSAGVWFSMFLILVSALCGAITDLAFSARGYFWQGINCLFTAAYSLYLRYVIDRVATVTSDGKRLGELSMVFYNNLLSLPIILALMAINQEYHTVWEQRALLWHPGFQTAVLASCMVGFGVSFTTLWFLSTCAPTTFSVTGCLKNIPVAAAGLFLFNAPWSIENVSSVGVGLVAGVVFVLAKTSGR